MRKYKIEYCKITKKYIFSSEAKAMRSLNKYEDIKRVYFCKHCESFHTTSKEQYLEFNKPKEKENISLQIKKRLLSLKKRIEKEK